MKVENRPQRGSEHWPSGSSLCPHGKSIPPHPGSVGGNSGGSEPSKPFTEPKLNDHHRADPKSHPETQKLVENEKLVPDLDQELAIVWTHDEFVTYSHLDNIK